MVNKKIIHLQIENVVSALISISVFMIYFSYIHHLEKSQCKCSLNWRQRFIKNYILVMIVLAFITMVVPTIMNNKTFIFLYSVISIAYFVILGQWLWQLHKSKCKCSDDWRKSMMEVLYIISLTITILLILFMVSFGIKVKGLKLLNKKK